MLKLHTDKIGDMFIIECEGSIVKQHAVSRLYDCVVSHADSTIIVLDLSELFDISRTAIEMLVSLQRWALKSGVQLKIFNPSSALRFKLRQAKAKPDFDIAPLPEMMHLLSEADQRYSMNRGEHDPVRSNISYQDFGMAA